MRVRAPGSTANLGPGFDVLGLAVSRYVWAATEREADDESGPRGASEREPCGPAHIARIAYEAAGGSSPIWFGFELEPGRGLGFSAAARAAGAALAFREQGHDTASAQELAYPIVAELEGHGDNAAPAVFGGLHIIAGDLTHRVTASMPGNFLFWVPELETATDHSRLVLPTEVPRADAVFNLGRIALLTAAIYEGRLDLLHQATQDQLHQPQRFSQCGESKSAIDIALDAGAAAAWLSGSGPSVAAVVSDDAIEAVKLALQKIPGSCQSTTIQLSADSEGAIEAS